jgi:hypothetical protein
VFGSHAWAHIPLEKRRDLEPQSQECIFVGYLDSVKGYKLLNPFTEFFFIEISVKFEEGPLHATKEEPTTDPLVLVDVDLTDASLISLDEILDLDEEEEVDDIDEHVVANLIARPLWAQQTLQAMQVI